MSADPAELKRAAAEAALSYVQSGMVLGLGTGSTVRFLVDLLAEALSSGVLEDVVGVPTSRRTEEQATELGVPLAELGEVRAPDLTIDGADEVSPELDLIKGMGGALLREKMVAQVSARFVIIADDRKKVRRLGTLSPLPVEVVEWGLASHRHFLESLGANVTLRVGDDGPVRSDNGNVFLDCRFSDGIHNPTEVARLLETRAGVVEHGLFLGLADTAVIAAPGGVEIVERDQ